MIKIFFILFSTLAFAQQNIEVHYKMLTLFDGAKNYHSTLSYSDNSAIFKYKLSDDDAIDKEYVDTNEVLKVYVADKDVHTIFTDLQQKSISEIMKSVKEDKNVLVKDSLIFPKWKVTQETKKINDHICYKATSEYKGRSYDAWFTLDYPTFFGPWKLHGLPGLILEVHDKKNEVFFEVTEIKNVVSKIDTPPASMEIVTSKLYKNELSKYLEELTNRINSLGDRNSTIKSTAVIKKGIELE